MATKKRTIMVEHEVEVTVCDWCDEESSSNGDRAAQWIDVRPAYRLDGFHFCSMRCLAEWAAVQAEAEKAAGIP